MQVKFVDFEKQYNPIREEIDKAIKNVVDSYWFVNGKELSLFENNFAEYVGTKYCKGVGSGSDALFLALKAIGIGTNIGRDEVIVPDQTFLATMSSVILAGGKPVVCPCRKDTFNLDYKQLEKYITKNTRAVIFVHLYGSPSGILEVKEICKNHNLYLIEDAAQAAGACCTLNSKEINCGAIGDIGCFSFYPSKNLGCFGQGGAITTNNRKIYDFAKLVSNCGMINQETVGAIGVNSRLDDIQAAILNVNLKYLDDWNIKRNIVAAFFEDRLSDEGFKIQEINVADYSVYHLYAVDIENSVDARNYLNSKGIEARQHYAFSMGEVSGQFKNTFSMLSLPMHPYVTEEEVNYVCDELIKWRDNV